MDSSQSKFSRASARLENADRVARLRVQHVRNEFVVALDIQVAQVEIDDAAANFRALPYQIDRPVMPLEQRPEMPRDDRQLDHFRERKLG